MAILQATRLRRRQLLIQPVVITPPTQRDWFPTRQAASMIGVSERTLRRRLEKPHWIDGHHYRWVKRQSRQTLEINVPRAIRLMDQRGWG